MNDVCLCVRFKKKSSNSKFDKWNPPRKEQRKGKLLAFTRGSSPWSVKSKSRTKHIGTLSE